MRRRQKHKRCRFACLYGGHSVENKEIFSGGVEVVEGKLIFSLRVCRCGDLAESAVLNGTGIGIGEVEYAESPPLSFAFSGVRVTAENPFLTLRRVPTEALALRSAETEES